MATAPEKLTKVTGTFLRETPKAFLCEVETLNNLPIEPVKEHWFPFSQVREFSVTDTPDGDVATFLASEWILKAKEII